MKRGLLVVLFGLLLVGCGATQGTIIPLPPRSGTPVVEPMQGVLEALDATPIPANQIPIVTPHLLLPRMWC